MLRFMTEHYSNLKSGIGISRQEESQQEPLDSLVSQMKPNSSLHNFRDFLKDRQTQSNQSLSYK
jgi:hypothetical protein